MQKLKALLAIPAVRYLAVTAIAAAVTAAVAYGGDLGAAVKARVCADGGTGGAP